MSWKDNAAPTDVIDGVWANPSGKGQYIPPTGIWFRLRSFANTRVINCNGNYVGSYPEAEDYDDHYFTFVKGRIDGLYKIQCKQSRKFLCAGK